MEIFGSLAEGEHEQVVFWSDKVAHLRSIIAIHDTTLGPAIGGVRMFPYKSEDEALKDVLLLSRSMTYKAAAAGINLGGGQGVIIGDPSKDKNELVLRSFGRFVQSLNGRFITAEDAGTTVEDMEIVRYETEYVTGLSGALGGGGDPGPVTAIGMMHGLLACVEKVFGKKMLEGVSVAIQGLGNVGFNLADISTTVYLWHGEEDRAAPPAMGRYLTRAIPNCRAKFLPGEGHTTLFLNHADDIFGVLTS